MLSDRGFSAL